MSRRGRPRHRDILTPREWEVLDLIRAGLPNQAIAERLGITLAGVKFHVSEILTKLGVSSREEAAAWQAPRRFPATAPLLIPLRRLRALLGPVPAALRALPLVAVVAIAVLVWREARPQSLAPRPDKNEGSRRNEAQRVAVSGALVDWRGPSRFSKTGAVVPASSSSLGRSC